MRKRWLAVLIASLLLALVVLVAAGPWLTVNGNIARASIPIQLHLVEGVLHIFPNNHTVLEILALGWGTYAFGFVEDEIHELKEVNPARAEVLTARGHALYLRSMTYGLRLLANEDGQFLDMLDQSPEKIAAALQEIKDPDAIPALFWTAFGLAGAMTLGADQLDYLVQVPKVELLLARVVELDEAFLYAAPVSALGYLYASRTPLYGGDPEKGKAYFERAIALTRGKFLMHKVLYASSYALQTQNRALFERLLTEVLQTPVGTVSEQRLANVLAHRRAKRSLSQVDSLF